MEMFQNVMAETSALTRNLHTNIADFAMQQMIYFSIRMGSVRYGINMVTEYLEQKPTFVLTPYSVSDIEIYGEYKFALDMYERYIRNGENEERILEARAGIARCHYYLGHYDLADSLAAALMTERAPFTEDQRLGRSILTRARFEARLVRFLIRRARILRVIYIFIIAGIFLLIALRKHAGRLLFS
jgi:hypothetical protein